MTWEKKKPIKSDELHIGCLNCSTAALEAPMDMVLCVGFGVCQVYKDNELFYDGEQAFRNDEDVKDLQQIENEAEKDPDHDWRVISHGPMHGETFQRHGDKKWVCIESNQGFA